MKRLLLCDVDTFITVLQWPSCRRSVNVFTGVPCRTLSWTRWNQRQRCESYRSSPYKMPRMPRGGVEVHLYSFVNLGARWDGWSTPRPGRFIPGKDPLPLYRRLGGPQGRSGRVREISPPTGVPSSDRPALSESLYRLSSPYSCKSYFWEIYFIIILPPAPNFSTNASF